MVGLSSFPYEGSGTVSVAFADKSVTTIVYAYHNGFAPYGCRVFGRVIAG